MAENVTIARPYAEATFKLACETDALDSWSEALDRLATVIANPDMQNCITDPKLSSSQVVELIEAAAGKLSIEQHNFVYVLTDNERLSVLQEIRDLFVDLKNEHEGILEAHITSAFPLNDATFASLKALLETRFKAKLKIEVCINPDLIGGVRIAVGDEVIDASVRGKLANMATALKN